MDLNSLGKWLMGLGAGILLVGGALTCLQRVPWLGRLPGDIVIKKEHFSFYFPVTTCFVVSVVISLFLRFLGRK